MLLTAPWAALNDSSGQEIETSATELQTDMHELCLHLAYYMIGNSGLNRAHHYTTTGGRHVGQGREGEGRRWHIAGPLLSPTDCDDDGWTHLSAR